MQRSGDSYSPRQKGKSQEAMQAVEVDSRLDSEELLVGVRPGNNMNRSVLRKAPLAVAWRRAETRDTRIEDQILYRSQVLLIVCVFQLVITDV